MTTFDVGDPAPVADIRPRSTRPTRGDTGRRGPDRDEARGGRYVRATPAAPGVRMTMRDLALDATLRAAAPSQIERHALRPIGPALRIEPADLQRKLRRRKASTTILFVVDASGSMGARKRMVETKGAILSLLLDAYQRRDRVGLVAFHGDGARLLLPPTSSVELARERLRLLPTGGRTPLAHGLASAHRAFQLEARRFPLASRLLVLISDGRANVPLADGGAPIPDAIAAASAIARDHILALAIDTETGPLRFNTMTPIARALDARPIRIEDVHATRIARSVRAMLPA
jgi:magnesium chelatase subunit D